MRRLLAWILVTLGLAALVRKLRRRGADTSHTSAGGDPADELRRKLADTREDAPQAPAAETTVEERRDEVHGQGRAAIDEMQRSSED